MSPRAHLIPSCSLSINSVPVLDILATMLYIDFLELKALNESTENPTLSVVPIDCDKAKRREMVQNKILAVGCISYMFSVLRCAVVVL